MSFMLASTIHTTQAEKQRTRVRKYYPNDVNQKKSTNTFYYLKFSYLCKRKRFANGFDFEDKPWHKRKNLEQCTLSIQELR